MLQTKIFNRLMFITQNALAYFAYPSINTKRYIHSLGTMHIVAHMYKNALINTNDKTKDNFIKSLKRSIEKIIEKENLQLNLNDVELFEDNSLYEFLIPLKSNKSKSIYLISLQALRIAGLLHDIGHFPFSHQVEYALEKLYLNLSHKDHLNTKEQKFYNFFKTATNNNDEVLHEAMGSKLVKVLFEHELHMHKDDYSKLLYLIVKNILKEKNDLFDYRVLHSFIDATIDADRLDYVNRDMLASGYISGTVDFMRIVKQTVLVQQDENYLISFFDSSIVDVEHMLQMRFDLYKKVIYNHQIAASDTHLENVIVFMANQYFDTDVPKSENPMSISMLWSFMDENDLEKRLDTISLMDENWMITLFKNEYFKIKYKSHLDTVDKKYLKSFEEVLFGKRFFLSLWKNLHEFYNQLEFSQVQRYQYRESFGYVSKKTELKLQKYLEAFCSKWEKDGRYFSFQIVSINIGIDKNFSFFDSCNLIKIDEVSTLRKRLKKSILNTVPFYLYSNETVLNPQMIDDIQQIMKDCF
ncbi:MAG: hypothetical protein IE909_06395 [Campylobacterales bacterium]|nr:hypothetical protein [Campylobacterales bacterium]